MKPKDGKWRTEDLTSSGGKQNLPRPILRRGREPRSRRNAGLLEQKLQGGPRMLERGLVQAVSPPQIKRLETRGRTCWLFAFTVEEFEEAILCTAPLKACGMDSVYFSNQEMPSHQESRFRAGQEDGRVEFSDRWDEENNWLLEGRTVLIFKGGDRKDHANYRPITCLPTITKMVTLAIHKRMRRWLFGSVNSGILECEQRGVRTSQGCKEAVIENVASNLAEEREKSEVVEFYYDFKKGV